MDRVEDDQSDDQSKELSHVEAMKKVNELQELILSDPFLQDLPSDVSLDEVQSKLALEQGRGIHLNLRRLDNDVTCELCKGFFCVLPVHNQGGTTS